MRKYKVWLKRDNASPVSVAVDADDVNLESENEAVFWNFTITNDDDDTSTVAGFPFANVDYFTSEPIQ